MLTQPATLGQFARLGNDRAPVILTSPFRWNRVDQQVFPPENEQVWTSDGRTVRLGHWQYAGSGAPLDESGWCDVYNQPIKVTDWLFHGESATAPPPPIPHLRATGGIVGFLAEDDSQPSLF